MHLFEYLRSGHLHLPPLVYSIPVVVDSAGSGPLRLITLSVGVTFGLLLSGCSSIQNDLDKGLAYGMDKDRLNRKIDKRPKSGKSKINSYVWKASLDAVRAYPLLANDASRGIIVTDWYAAPGNPDDRRQIRIEVMGPDIRRDTLFVSVARQVRNSGESVWSDAAVQATVAQSLEDDIIFTAKDIRGW